MGLEILLLHRTGPSLWLQKCTQELFDHKLGMSQSCGKASISPKADPLSMSYLHEVQHQQSDILRLHFLEKTFLFLSVSIDLPCI